MTGCQCWWDWDPGHWGTGKSRGIQIPHLQNCLEAVVDTGHREKCLSQGRDVEDAAAAANYSLIVRERPVREAEAGTEISINVAQLFGPPCLFRGQEGSAGTRVGRGVSGKGF